MPKRTGSKARLITLLSVFLMILMNSCGGEKEFKKSPVDRFIRDMTNVPMFTIMLYDMNVEGTFFKDYQHKYRIISHESPDARPEEKITDWYEVDREFFQRNEQNMGMELASKGEDGKIDKTASPPGYSNYVGNQRYGQWQNRNGNSFWAFYGQYAFMNSMFNMATFPARRSYYNDYQRYNRSGRPYYGSSRGRPVYGTGSTYTSTTRPNSTYRTSNRFSSRRNSRTSRSGSRYSGSSGFRSRSSGFGK